MFRSQFTSLLQRLRRPPVVLRRAVGAALITIELRQWLPVVVLGFIFLWYLAAPTEAAALSVAALGMLLACAYFWARQMALHVTAQRRLHYTALQVGDEIEEIVVLYNASPLPVMWAEFLDRSNLPGYTVSSVRMADAQSTTKWRAHTLCTQRGTFMLGPWELRLGDPLGIFLIRQVYTQQQEVLIYPPLAPLPPHLLPHTAAVGTHRPLHQPLPAETINAITIRAYQPGDPLRRVHWRTTAHRQALFTKVFEPEASSTIWLIPDFDPTAHWGTGADSTEETMVLLAASLAAQLLKMNLAVGLLASTDTLKVVSPRPGSMHLWTLLRALAPLHPVPGPAGAPPRDLAHTLAQVRPLISIGDLLVVITPAIAGPWPLALRKLVHAGSAAEAILLDPESFGGPGQVRQAGAGLMEYGLSVSMVRRGELQPMSSVYGALRRWEFMTLGTGRVVARQKPREAAEKP